MSLKDHLKRNVKGDFPFFAILPIIMLVLIVVCSILITGWNMVNPIMASIANSLNVPANYQAASLSVGNNLYTFNVYLVLIFFAALIGSLVSLVMVDPDPTNWLLGVFMLPFSYWIAAYTSNIARAVLTSPVLASGVSYLALPVFIMAHLQDIIALFAFVYVVLLAVRMYFYNPSNRQAVATR